MRKIIVLILVLFAVSCNPYKRIAKTEPRTTKDTVNLAKRAHQTFPPQKPIYIPGKIIYLQDSSDYYKSIADSLRKRSPKDSIIRQVIDTCKKDAIDSYNEGYKFGYKVGRYDGKSECEKSTKQVDTVKVPDTTGNYLQAQKLRETEANNITLTAQVKIYKQERTSYFWLFVGTLAILISVVGIGAYNRIKKAKING